MDCVHEGRAHPTASGRAGGDPSALGPVLLPIQRQSQGDRNGRVLRRQPGGDRLSVRRRGPAPVRRSRATPSHLPLHQVRPDARLLDEDRKLITHAIRIAAYNAESTLARMLRPHYSRADDEARALLREAFTLSGDLHVSGDTLHVRLDPATAPRRSRALHALCQQLTETGTRYPDTNLTISYGVKGQPDTS